MSNRGISARWNQQDLCDLRRGDKGWVWTIPPVSAYAFLLAQRVDLNGVSKKVNIPMPSIVLSSNGNNVTNNCTVLIDATPQMPPLIASLSPQPTNTGLTVTWHAQLSWTQTVQKGNCTKNTPSTIPYTDVPLVPSPSTQSAFQSYCLTPGVGCLNTIPFNEVRGGNAQVWFDYGGKTSSVVTCQILGQYELDESTVKSAITAAPWYYPMMIREESGYHQFKTDNRPNLGYPCGFGVAQVDPPGDTSTVWNWRTNLTKGISIANAALTNAKTAWAQFLRNYDADAAADPGAEQPPCFAFIGSPHSYCFFQYPDPFSPIPGPGYTTASWGDANGIRRYNRGQNTLPQNDFLIYIPASGVKRGFWKFDKSLNDSYVANICSQVP